MEKRTIILASRNQGKCQEIAHFLKGLALVKTLDEVRSPVKWEESGSSFRENAWIKARALSDHTSFCVLADDSGLCIRALGGAPGIYSARWAGSASDDNANNHKLQEELRYVEHPFRKAEFVCCLVFIDEKKQGFEFYGKLQGQILKTPRGQFGFGYDPFFLPKGHERTLAEYTLAEKNAFSHRSQALAHLRQFLTSY